MVTGISVALETAFQVQEAVTRDTGRTVPYTLELNHDSATYYRQRHALLLTDEADASRRCRLSPLTGRRSSRSRTLTSSAP